MSDPRVIKVTFPITGEIEIFDHGDDYVTFRSQDEMKRYDKKHAKRIIERNIKVWKHMSTEFKLSLEI